MSESERLKCLQIEYEKTLLDARHREAIRPSVIYKPAISLDGNQWCFLYGENLQDGVAGFGNSPALAAEAFDRAWYEERAQ